MAKHDKEPDKVEHKEESSFPFGLDMNTLPRIHTTTIHKDGETYTGTGWSEDEANTKAGGKYNNGEKEK